MVGFLLAHRAGSHLYLTAFGSRGQGVGYIANLLFVFVASVAIVLVGALVLLWARRGKVKDLCMPIWTPMAIGVVGCFLGLFEYDLEPWFAVGAGVLYAASFILLSFSWYELFAREGPLEGTIALAVSILGSSLLANALSDLAPAFLYSLDALCFIASTVILRRLRGQAAVSGEGLSLGERNRPAEDWGSPRAAMKSFAGPLMTLAVLEMTVGTFNVTSLNGYGAVMSSISTWMSTGVGAGLFLAILLLARVPRSSEFIYLRLFPILMAVLGGCIVAGNSLSVVTGVVVLVSYSLFTFSVSYAMFALCRDFSIGFYPFMAINLIVTKTALIGGFTVGLVIMNFFDGQTLLTSAIVFSIYILAMVAVVVQRFARRENDPGGTQKSVEEMHAHGVEVFGDAYGLTSREREVFSLVVRGWGAKQIADELRVSENTVWSHIKHVYAKLGVQSKQEAINLWEGDRLPARSVGKYDEREVERPMP